MATPVITRSTLRNGIWEGRIETAEGAEPAVEVCLGERALPGLSLRPDGAGSWELSVAIPADCISDGVQTFVIRERESGLPAGHFTLVAGAAAEDDLRAEIALLRAEIDMLKQAFRRHVAAAAPDGA